MKRLILATMLLLGGCTQTVTVDTMCLSVKPISYSAKSDSMETIRQIRELNAVYSAQCL